MNVQDKLYFSDSIFSDFVSNVMDFSIFLLKFYYINNTIIETKSSTLVWLTLYVAYVYLLV
jgi:hypothetical protein